MSIIVTVLPYIQILLSILLVGAVLLQRSEAGLGSGFGGDNLGNNKHTRRGFEKTLFTGTIVLGCLFAISAFAALILK